MTKSLHGPYRRGWKRIKLQTEARITIPANLEHNSKEVVVYVHAHGLLVLNRSP